MRREAPVSARVVAAPRWLVVEEAAVFLSLSPDALRKSLERAAVRVADGGIEAHLDGVRGRKLGRRWRVQMSAAWSEVSDAADRRIGR